MTDPNRYLILVEGDAEHGHSAWSPDLPGCVAAAEDLQECVDEMRAAITAHLQLLVDAGDPVPQPSGPGVYLEQPLAA